MAKDDCQECGGVGIVDISLGAVFPPEARPCSCRKLAIQELLKLKPGDKFVVYWAKDDNPRDVRLDYETQTVTSNDGETLIAGDYDWYKHEGDRMDPEGNMLDTGRGYAYFYTVD